MPSPAQDRKVNLAEFEALSPDTPDVPPARPLRPNGKRRRVRTNVTGPSSSPNPPRRRPTTGSRNESTPAAGTRRTPPAIQATARPSASRAAPLPAAPLTPPAAPCKEAAKALRADGMADQRQMRDSPGVPCPTRPAGWSATRLTCGLKVPTLAAGPPLWHWTRLSGQATCWSSRCSTTMARIRLSLPSSWHLGSRPERQNSRSSLRSFSSSSGASSRSSSWMTRHRTGTVASTHDHLRPSRRTAQRQYLRARNAVQLLPASRAHRHRDLPSRPGIVVEG